MQQQLKQKQWLIDHAELLNNKGVFEKLVTKIQSYLNGELPNITFAIIYKEVFEVLSNETKDFEKHTLQNMCLLDGRTNSSLNKSVFEVKRSKVRERELEGNFIPISSRNVFLKTYSKYPKNSNFWDKDDRLDYVDNIKTVLHDFFPENWQLNNLKTNG